MLKQFNKQPTMRTVKEIWNEYVLQEESKVAQEFASLNASQKRLLVAISKGTTNELSGKNMLSKLNLSSAAVVKGLKSLEEKDYVYKDKKEQYQILDPLIKTSLHIFYA